jgi:outer membrane protein assembly factor BamD
MVADYPRIPLRFIRATPTFVFALAVPAVLSVPISCNVSADMNRIPRILLPVLCALALAGCATSPQPRSLGADAQSMFTDVVRAIEVDDLQAARQASDGLYEAHPESVQAAQAQLELAYAHATRGDYAGAMALCDVFERRYPQHASLDYVYFLRGLAAYAQWRTRAEDAAPVDADALAALARTAFGHYRDLLERFPDSTHAGTAFDHAQTLREALAEHELRAAVAAFQDGDMQNAAARAAWVVEHYPGTAAEPNALALLVQAYRALGEEASARAALDILRFNHPDHPATRLLLGR